MSKEIKSLPEMYQGMNRDTARLKHTIVEDVHQGFYRFDKPEACHIVKQAIHKIWPNFDTFEKENKQTILTYHENLFKKPAPKEQSHVETCTWVWYKIADLAVDRTERTPTSDSGRKSTILNRKYFLGEDGTGDLKTPQALACIRLFRRAVTDVGEDSGSEPNIIRHVTEEKLRKFIEENATELRTKQDPWRIFQYYRPNLLKAKLIRHD